MEYRLRVGKKLSGLVLRPDAEYPQMWRIHHRGQISDMVNLARAKDAALTWVRSKKRNSSPIEEFYWEPAETAVAAP